ncbi:hypothetical protein RHGRI_007696 [Rhododendron griersonianum]|uniref:Uncharacterized protein n=1 Tax=Rhododendron griersonianum TaxID=479676 RepID=A0AAV6KY19_9ERIC|nr:hypothetical protein RHGRI_007696 [Rhododendron griersonianum]
MGLSDGTSPRKARHDDSDLETFELESLDHGVRLVESSGLPLWSFIKQSCQNYAEMNAKKAQREILTVNSQQQIVAGVETPSVERSRLAQGRPERSQRGRRRRGERGRRSAVGISGIQALEPYWGKRCSKGGRASSGGST